MIKVTAENVNRLPTETLTALWNLIDEELDLRERDAADPSIVEPEDARAGSIEDLDPMYPYSRM